MRHRHLASLLALVLAAPTAVSAQPARAVIERAVRALTPEIRRCHERASAREGNELEGTIAVRFLITADGSVSTARIERSSIDAPSLADCILDVVLRLRFPAMGEPLDVVFPFVFRSEDG
jgi:TonB family protein